MRRSSSLTAWAVESGTLCLDDTADVRFAAAGAKLPFAVIDLVVVLVTPVLVECVSVGAVA